jgi:glycogen debranching enzyme
MTADGPRQAPVASSGEAAAWASDAAPPAYRDTTSVTLLEGSSFCLCSANGDIEDDRVAGMFVWDTRFLSRWLLNVDGDPVEPLATVRHASHSATFVGRAAPPPGHADSRLLVMRVRQVAAGMREEIVLRNHSDETASVVVTLETDSDFADVFEVKERRVVNRARGQLGVAGADLTHVHPGAADTRSTTVRTSGAHQLSGGRATFRAVVPARGDWRTTLTVVVAVDGRTAGRVGTRVADPGPQEHVPGRRATDRQAAWRRSLPVLMTGHEPLTHTLRCTTDDLGALQIPDPDEPARRVVAAGAPWFMALFGRDALLTSWMALPLDQQLALGTLQTLARFQGRRTDPVTEEQPGRILHEVRLGATAALALGGGQAYYGTADATPLFVALVGELHKWGLPRRDLEPLLPAVDQALAWIAGDGDPDGDGFVEYQRMTASGLLNQGWKDSFDGVNHASGRLAQAPIALAEVQAYVYAALVSRARLAEDWGDPGIALACHEKAADLKRKFNDRFWLPFRGWFAVGLDRDKEPIDALTSNVGHCLWTGIVDDDKAAVLADRLAGPSMLTGFGVRTLDEGMGAYNPMSYHNGSVWPHDSAIVAAGLLRYGFTDAGKQVAFGLLDAAARSGGRLPELFCGYSREEFADPVPYPTSCSPQAWAAASPLLLMRALLGFEPDLPAGRLRMRPTLPESWLPLRIENLPLGTARVTVEVRADGCAVDGLPPDVHLDAPEVVTGDGASHPPGGQPRTVER